MENTQARLVMSPAPHVSSGESISRIMYTVLAALVPAALASIYYFRLRAVLLIIVCSAAALATEYVFQKARNKPITIWDGSALITGVLLAFNVPPSLPLWMAVVGTVVAIAIGKQVFGGLGHNPFNPALVGRAFLLAAFPVAMTTWTAPIDGATTATPLALMKMEGTATSLWQLFIGRTGGSLGETSAIAILIGGLYLIYKGYIDWRVPTGYLGTVFVLSLIFGQNPFFHLFAGGLMLGAFFMATDMVTSPITAKGRLIFAIGAGVILMVIRLWGGYPEGVSYSILLMNGFTPLINRYTRPRMFGEVRTNA